MAMTPRSLRLLSRSLKLVAVTLGLGFLVLLFLMMSHYANSIPIPRWYANLALSNNFAFLILVGLPFLLVFLPVGFTIEWLGNKAEQAEESARERESKR
jgi:hypothetical protein